MQTDVGYHIGDYHVEGLLGSGSMAQVYLARHRTSGQQVALKLLSEEYVDDGELRARFLNEARSLGRVMHPGLVRVHEFGLLEAYGPYMVLEYLNGDSLDLVIEEGELGLLDKLSLAQQIAAALLAAHGCGIVHRDLKPQNLIAVSDPQMLGGRRVKVVDFGIAKLTPWLDDDMSEVHTRAGVLMGTPAYMAPEQCQGADLATERADVYSLGVILYEMLCGELPFVGAAVPVMMKHICETPRALRSIDPYIPPEVAALVQDMMTKDPDLRPAMAEVDRRLRRLLAVTLVPALERAIGELGEAQTCERSLGPSIEVVTLSRWDRLWRFVCRPFLWYGDLGQPRDRAASASRFRRRRERLSYPGAGADTDLSLRGSAGSLPGGSA